LLAGLPILRRTVQQVCQVKELSGIFVLASSTEVSKCRDLLAGLDVTIQSVESAPPPWTGLVQASRKWSLDGWRGGVGGSTVFDEFTDCRVLSGLLEHCPADAVLGVPAAAPLFDPQLASQMIQQREKHHGEARLTFTQAVPGLAGIVLDASLIRELATASIPISRLFSYKPDQPQKDLIFQAACLDIDAPLRFASGRLTADTDRAMRTLSALFDQKESWSLQEIGQFLVERDERGFDAFPREVELELTNDDPFPDALLAPRGLRLGRSGSMDLDVVRKIASEMAQYDDALCVLGGFGDPLQYAEFESVLEIFRPRIDTSAWSSAIFGLCVRTSGAGLTSEIARALIEHHVDVFNVSVDGWTEGTFRRVKGLDSEGSKGLSDILQNLESLAAKQRQQFSPTPIVVPEMIKAKENVGELDNFFDGWLRRSGAVSVTGYSHYAGQMPDRSVMDMRPPLRTPCRRLRTRCLILADGRVALCDQDFRGLHTFGNVRDFTIAEIWQSSALQDGRHDHLAGRFEAHALCRNCAEWHRP
jgi:spiro-SPASM protein